jgi:hypothetical protein
MSSKLITLRTVLRSVDVLSLLEEPEFKGSTSLHAHAYVEPLSDHFLAVFVYEAESDQEGALSLRAVSTTVAGIQRFTTKRLRGQGIYVESNPKENVILWGTLRAHFRAQEQELRERLNSISGPKLRWTMDFPNGAGDLATLAEFVIEDPDLAALEGLLSKPDPRPQQDDNEEDDSED